VLADEVRELSGRMGRGVLIECPLVAAPVRSSPFLESGMTMSLRTEWVD
jgi:hypothetical protein